MIKPFQIIRVFQINLILMRHALTPSVLGQQPGILRFLSYLNPFQLFSRKKTRGESLRITLENLGPIFVKFGQLLSTRRDLLPEDIASELAKLQDRVPPFSGTTAIKIIEAAFNNNIETLFAEFTEKPLASASIAQVHAAKLHDGSDVIVKVLRPKIKKVIKRDISLLYFTATLAERFWKHGKRLHPVDLVAEFEQTITDELDLMREAANASQLRRNFSDSKIMYVPKIYWDYTRHNVMVMERIHGIQISNISALKEHNTNMKKLAEFGVEIFFTQVFRDSFFHADMHPGNLFVDIKDPNNPVYLGVDFGIMGTLSPVDQHYLAGNILAFFQRDYRRVAVLHVESGWVPADTRVDQFESAIRTVCEPIFERPLQEISFGQLLLRLFQTAERFHMEVQPQLMLLQKTLLAIEGLGRMLYPSLDLWQTAKPFMESWMKKQRSVRRIIKENSIEWDDALAKIIRSPQLVYDVLAEINYQQRALKSQPKEILIQEKNPKSHFLFGISLILLVIFGVSFIPATFPPESLLWWRWLSASIGVILMILAWGIRR